MSLDVIIPWGGSIDDPWRTSAFWWVRRRYHKLLPEATVIIGTSNAEPFNRSEARNNAFAYSDADILVVADADTVFQPEAIRGAVNAIERGAPWVIPYRENGGYYNLSQNATRAVFGRDPAEEIAEPVDEDDWEHKLTSWAGILVLPRTAWEKVGGYDEAFVGWGYEDNAFRVALDRLVGAHRRVQTGFVLHLWHEAPESVRFEQPFIEHNRRRFREYEAGIRP